jgi:hypothetical protein
MGWEAITNLMVTTFLDPIPMWAMYLLTFMVALLGFELGYRFGLFQQKKGQTEPDKTLDAMVGATLGLLAFLLAFVMSMASDRYDNRRQLVVEEAQIIRSAYLQAGYLTQPYPEEIRSLLRDYVDLRIATPDTQNNIDEVLVRSEEMQAELWSLTEAVVEETPGRDEVSLFIASVNETINIHNRRVAALRARLPETIVLVLYLVATLTMAMVGFQNSYNGKRNYFSALSVILIFTVVMMLIIDLDRPQEGLLKVSQQALIDLQRQMSSMGK